MKRVLLVNPWIYDFSAYNLWMRPVGLLRVASYLRRAGASVEFFDCLSYDKVDQYGCGKFPRVKVSKPAVINSVDRNYYRFGKSVEEFCSFLKSIKRPDEVFIGTGMTYWYPGVFEVIRLLREQWRDVKIVLGGIYSTLCSEHAKKHSGADRIASSGEYFFPENYPAWDLIDSKGVIILQTSYGCPFECSYCGSKLLFQDFNQRNPDDIINEIEQFQPTDIAFYDDALLFNKDKHFKVILRKILAKGLKCRFHLPNAVHARFIDKETAFLMKQVGFVTLRLGLETSGEKRKDNKVTNEEFLQAVNILKQEGFGHKEIGVYTMFGSLDDRPEDIISDIDFVTKRAKVHIKLSAYSLVPESNDCKRWVSEGRLKSDMDPLWHNNTIFPLLNKEYTLDTIRKLRRLASEKNKNTSGIDSSG